jgi:hypothetical protein
MKPVEIPVFRGAGDIIFRAIKIPTKSSVLPLSLNDPVKSTRGILKKQKNPWRCPVKTLILVYT